MTPLEQLNDHERRLKLIEAAVLNVGTDPFVRANNADPFGQAPPDKTVPVVDQRMRLTMSPPGPNAGKWIAPPSSTGYGPTIVLADGQSWYNTDKDVDAHGS